MLATPDDISNLNLNNLAGSALGLWDYARTFLLSFLVLSFSLSLSAVLPCRPLFLAAALSLAPSLLYVPRWLTLAHTNTRNRMWLIKSLLFVTQRWDGDRLLILNWSNIYNIVQSQRPCQISPGGQTNGVAAILKNIEPSEMFAFLWFFTPAHFFSRAFFALWPGHGLIKVYTARVDKYLVPCNFAARW